jgi:hypothetical protein
MTIEEKIEELGGLHPDGEMYKQRWILLMEWIEEQKNPEPLFSQEEIESMTGMIVKGLNIHCQAVFFEKCQKLEERVLRAEAKIAHWEDS